MMSNKQFREMTTLLKSIDEKLDTLVNFQRTLMPKPKLTKEEKKILKLCDRKNTISEIATKTGKTSNNVNFLLTQLRRKGIIRSVKIKDRTVYEKI
jgi:DNA-binding CsgD family transcriptional regulator